MWAWALIPSFAQIAVLAMNPIGKVPTIELDDGRFLAESNAILLHFAEETRFLPPDRYDRAKAYEWLSFEQYSHEPAIAVRRGLGNWLSRVRALPDHVTIDMPA
jgi:glutathione S-transferase